MPKRSFDLAGVDLNMPLDKTQRKTERSHEENQERAYIAASRRADRSIEARVQSARMASEIHKKRTGKAFRITEEIVMKEEMYEEEEDEFPRSYRLLGPHMQTSSAEMNSRVESYLSNRVAMSKLLSATEEDWKQNEVNRAFDQMFPNASRQAQSLSQRWSVPGYPAPAPPQAGRLQSPVDANFDPHFQHVNYGQDAHNERSRSMSVISPTDGSDEHSTPVLTPGSGSSHSDASQPRDAHMNNGMAAPPPPAMPAMYGMDNSAFTTELPPEAKMMLGGPGTNDVFSPPLYAQEWSAPPSFYDFGSNDMGKQAIKTEYPQEPYMSYGEFDPIKWDPSLPAANTTEDLQWDTFINDTEWNMDQQ